MTVSLDPALALTCALFALGVLGVLVRRDLLFMLISVELMLNAAGLLFVTAGARWEQPDGQVMFILVLAVAAAEASVGLAVLLRVSHRLHTVDADALDQMRG